MQNDTRKEGFSQGIGRWLGTAEVYAGNGTGFAPGTHAATLQTNQWEAWSTPGNFVGSYSMSGGRALSRNFHFLYKQLRIWRREVVSHDGNIKSVLHTWYRGGVRVGVQFGVLSFNN